MHRKIRVFLLIICFVMSCAGCGRKKTPDIQLEEVDLEETKEEREEKKTSIFVYVCGAVLNEGVYELESGSRVYEAIEKAGGFRENAAVTAVNQAKLLEDEEQIYVPTVEEMEKQQTENGTAVGEAGKINLNTASKEELMTLTGIGAAKAESIIRYREQQGGFKSVEEIKQIEGIKDGVYEKIKDNITV